VAYAFFTRPMTALKRALGRLRKAKKLIVPLLLAAGCAGVPEINQVPAVVLGEPSFFPTIAAHTDAPIVGGNRVDLLFNGKQIFPSMLEAIRGARKVLPMLNIFIRAALSPTRLPKLWRNAAAPACK
jgi:phosphatidylserine/phosphatidylglycerophosphate/cardiolipin synthase-like enzyme